MNWSADSQLIKMNWRDTITPEDIYTAFVELDTLLKSLSDVVSVIVLVDNDIQISIESHQVPGLCKQLDITIRNWMIIGKNAKANAIVSYLMKSCTHHSTRLSTGILNDLMKSLQTSRQQKDKQP